MLKKLMIAASVAVLTLWASTVAAEVEVLWLGHSTVRITSVEGKVIVIDPFLKTNPLAPVKYRDLKALGRVDLILITHGHFDHARDLPELAKLTGARVVAIWEYALNLVSLGILDADKVITPSIGGTIKPLGRGIKISMVPAEHSKSIDLEILGLKEADTKGPKFIPGGKAVGFVIRLETGFTISPSGDTSVFGDLALSREFYHPDLAMVSIGGFFTMDPEGAAYALKNFLKPKLVIPIHYGTFPVINRTPAELIEALGDSPIKVLDVKPGQVMTF